MDFEKFASLCEELEGISSITEMRKRLAEFFEDADDVKELSYLFLGRIASDFADVNIGMADKMVVKSIAEASGEDESKVTKKYKEKGDVGKVAESFASKRTRRLSVKDVFQTLHEIAEMSGEGSQDEKIQKLAGLFKKASPKESKYIARIVVGDMRLGLGSKTLLDGLAIAFTGEQENREVLEDAFYICPDIGIVAETLRKKGLKGVEKLEPELGRPLQMMLCQRVKDLEELKDRMDFPVVVEGKYDGERVQAHVDKGKITLFSRRLENITYQFPDIIESLKKALKVKSCIIEGEIMPVDEDNNIQPFQKLMQRRRKHDVEEYVERVPVTVFFFECLRKEGKGLIKEPLKKRYETLKGCIGENKHTKLVKRKICKDTECVQDFFDACLEEGLEGCIIKSRSSRYRAGVRGFEWIKWKPEYVKGLQDTFDLVVVGAFWGTGKRSGKYGSLLCAAYNKDKDRFETVCKVGSGYSDKVLDELPEKLGKHTSEDRPKRVVSDMEPDLWFRPGVVIEVLAAEITRSPKHTAGQKDGKGLSLRFPRFKRFREKKPSQATTVSEIRRMKEIS